MSDLKHEALKTAHDTWTRECSRYDLSNAEVLEHACEAYHAVMSRAGEATEFQVTREQLAALPGVQFYSIDSEYQIETHTTEQAAREACESELECDGEWPEGTEYIEWGVLVPFQEAHETDVVLPDADSDDERAQMAAANGWTQYCNYKLVDTAFAQRPAQPAGVEWDAETFYRLACERGALGPTSHDFAKLAALLREMGSEPAQPAGPTTAPMFDADGRHVGHCVTDAEAYRDALVQDPAQPAGVVVSTAAYDELNQKYTKLSQLLYDERANKAKCDNACDEAKRKADDHRRLYEKAERELAECREQLADYETLKTHYTQACNERSEAWGKYHSTEAKLAEANAELERLRGITTQLQEMSSGNLTRAEAAEARERRLREAATGSAEQRQAFLYYQREDGHSIRARVEYYQALQSALSDTAQPAEPVSVPDELPTTPEKPAVTLEGLAARVERHEKALRIVLPALAREGSVAMSAFAASDAYRLLKEA